MFKSFILLLQKLFMSTGGCKITDHGLRGKKTFPRGKKHFDTKTQRKEGTQRDAQITI